MFLVNFNDFLLRIYLEMEFQEAEKEKQKGERMLEDCLKLLKGKATSNLSLTFFKIHTIT